MVSEVTNSDKDLTYTAMQSPVLFQRLCCACLPLLVLMRRWQWSATVTGMLCSWLLVTQNVSILMCLLTSGNTSHRLLSHHMQHFQAGAFMNMPTLLNLSRAVMMLQMTSPPQQLCTLLHNSSNTEISAHRNKQSLLLPLLQVRVCWQDDRQAQLLRHCNCSACCIWAGSLR